MPVEVVKYLKTSTAIISYLNIFSFPDLQVTILENDFIADNTDAGGGREISQDLYGNNQLSEYI